MSGARKGSGLPQRLMPAPPPPSTHVTSSPSWVSVDGTKAPPRAKGPRNVQQHNGTNEGASGFDVKGVVPFRGGGADGYNSDRFALVGLGMGGFCGA